MYLDPTASYTFSLGGFLAFLFFLFETKLMYVLPQLKTQININSNQLAILIIQRKGVSNMMCLYKIFESTF